jgi:hypothetical protein
LVGVALTTVIAAAPAYEEKLEQIKQTLNAQFVSCTEQFGYDPQKSLQLGPQQIGDGELEWRQCAYDGISRVVIPNTRLPGAYEQLIAEDRRLTAALQRGEITRKQRYDAIQKTIDEIRTSEAAQVTAQQQAEHQAQQQTQQQAMRQFAASEMNRMKARPFGFERNLPGTVGAGMFPAR